MTFQVKKNRVRAWSARLSSVLILAVIVCRSAFSRLRQLHLAAKSKLQTRFHATRRKAVFAKLGSYRHLYV